MISLVGSLCLSESTYTFIDMDGIWQCLKVFRALQNDLLCIKTNYIYLRDVEKCPASFGIAASAPQKLANQILSSYHHLPIVLKDT